VKDGEVALFNGGRMGVPLSLKLTQLTLSRIGPQPDDQECIDSVDKYGLLWLGVFLDRETMVINHREHRHLAGTMIDDRWGWTVILAIFRPLSPDQLDVNFG